MLNFIYKSLPHLKFSARISPIHGHNVIQIHPLSSSASLATLKKSTSKEPSFTVSYLINTCGFSPLKALRASKYINFDKPEMPNSVIEFFKRHGFTRTQALSFVNTRPKLLMLNPEKTLLPKLQFLTSKGMSNSDVAKILSKAPDILDKSLENNIIPRFCHLKNMLLSDEKALQAIKRFPSLLLYDPQTYLAPNVEILRGFGVPESNIVVLLTNQPRAFMIDTLVFCNIAEEVKKMGFNPQKYTFVAAIHALRSMSKTTWAKKVVAFKKWGFSESDVLVAFAKYPLCITTSEDKIEKTMDFIVNKIGWDYSVVVRWPSILSLSLEKRIIPRCLVYQFLLSKGLIKNDTSPYSWLKMAENSFVDRFVEPFEEEYPELLKIYKGSDGNKELHLTST